MWMPRCLIEFLHAGMVGVGWLGAGVIFGAVRRSIGMVLSSFGGKTIYLHFRRENLRLCASH